MNNLQEIWSVFISEITFIVFHSFVIVFFLVVLLSVEVSKINYGNIVNS